MGSRNYIIPSDDMTLTDKTTYRLKAIAALLAGCPENIGKIGDDEIPGYGSLNTPAQKFQAVLAFLMSGKWPKGIDVREFQPIADAGTAVDQWNTAALAVLGTAYQVTGNIAAPVLANNKRIVFYKCGVETVPLPVSRLLFRKGGATGNVLGVFDLEQIINHQNIEGYFSEPVIIDVGLTFAVQVLARIATGVLARVQLGALVAEPPGNTVA